MLADFCLICFLLAEYCIVLVEVCIVELWQKSIVAEYGKMLSSWSVADCGGMYSKAVECSRKYCKIVEWCGMNSRWIGKKCTEFEQ